MILAALLLAVAFGAGIMFGAVLATRNAHRILARLSPPARLEFARKVSAAVRR